MTEPRPEPGPAGAAVPAPGETDAARETMAPVTGAAPGETDAPRGTAPVTAVAPGGTDAPPETGPPVGARGGRPRVLVSWIGVVALAFAAFATGLLLFDHLIMPQFTHGTSGVRVPDLTNLTEAQAEHALSAQGLRLVRSGERFDPSTPRGEVITQDPTPETAVRSGARVLVVMSLGEEFSTVPVLEGETVRSAELQLARADLTVGGVTRAPSDAIGGGLVAGTDPAPGAALPHAAPVSLLISAGTGADAWVMSSVLGRDLASAKRQLEAFGFKVSTPEAGRESGPVIFQNPPVGARIVRGAVITLRGAGARST